MDAGSFDLDTATGQLRTKSGVTYNYEAKSSYSVTMTVRDGNADTTVDDRIAVTVTLTDVPERPQFDGTVKPGGHGWG